MCRGSFLCGAYSACENLSSSYKVYGIARRNFGVQNPTRIAPIRHAGAGQYVPGANRSLSTLCAAVTNKNTASDPMKRAQSDFFAGNTLIVLQSGVSATGGGSVTTRKVYYFEPPCRCGARRSGGSAHMTARSLKAAQAGVVCLPGRQDTPLLCGSCPR